MSASGGPIPCQNHEGELFSWGLDTPSGSYIKFSGSQEKEIGLKRAKVSQAKPRLAVSLDYADLMCRDKYGQGVFSKFESQNDDGPFTIEINPKVKIPAKDWIDEIKLHIQKGQSQLIKIMEINWSGSHYKAVLPIQRDELIDFGKNPHDSIFFLSIKIKESILNQMSSEYDITTPWSFQVELLSKAKLIVETYNTTPFYPMDPGAAFARELARENSIKNAQGKGYVIRRHSKWGEVPWHWKYSQIDQIEYMYPWKTNSELEDSK